MKQGQKSVTDALLMIGRKGRVMRAIHKRLTTEDKFARKYYCNSYRFLPKMKRINRKKFRRKIKGESEC